MTNQSQSSASEVAGAGAVMQGGIRRTARILARVGIATTGIAGVTALVVGGLAPLIQGGVTIATLAEIVKSFGGNALAGWVGSLSTNAIKQACSDVRAQQEAGLADIARNLEVHLARNEALADDLARFLQQLDGIGTALKALETQVESQTDSLSSMVDQVAAQERLLKLLQADLYRKDIVRNKLHTLVVREIKDGTEGIITALMTLQSGQDDLSRTLKLVLASMQAMQSAITAMPTTVAAEPIRAVFKACDRRAVYTRFHAQMNHEAMFTSLRECRTTLQQLKGDILSESLQQMVADIIAWLDAIERYQNDGERINDAKLRIIGLLHDLSRASNVPYTLPPSVIEGVFFTKEEADSSP